MLMCSSVVMQSIWRCKPGRNIFWAGLCAAKHQSAVSSQPDCLTRRGKVQTIQQGNPISVMEGSKMVKPALVAILASLAAFVVLGTGPAGAQGGADFAGKNVTMVIGFGP